MNPALYKLAADVHLDIPKNEFLRLAFGFACVSRVEQLLEDACAIQYINILRELRTRASAMHPLQRSSDRENAGFPNQQLFLVGADNRRSLPVPLASGTVFKWIKQHLRIRSFFGVSENAVKTQLWIAISVYVLMAIIKKRLNISASLDQILQI